MGSKKAQKKRRGDKKGGRREVKEDVRERWPKVEGRGAKIRTEVGRGVMRWGGSLGRPVSDNVTWHTLLILAQRRDPASPSAQGQGHLLGSASHPPPSTNPAS